VLDITHIDLVCIVNVYLIISRTVELLAGIGLLVELIAYFS